jgi:hypothetical protein
MIAQSKFRPANNAAPSAFDLRPIETARLVA